MWLYSTHQLVTVVHFSSVQFNSIVKVSEYREEEVANNDEKRKIMIANQNILGHTTTKVYISIYYLFKERQQL